MFFNNGVICYDLTILNHYKMQQNNDCNQLLHFIILKNSIVTVFDE